jgi:Domain of unknown function (DUF6089)
MRKIITYAALLIFVLPLITSGQRLRNRWKAMRADVHFGIGATNFLGELGGANQIGTHYFKDFEFSQTRLALSAGYRYKISSGIAINTNISYGQVAGNDNLTTEFFRSYRNLSFKSDIFELASHLEFSFIKDQVGHRYRLKGVRGQRGFEMASYGFIGLGVFHFNPKAQYEGSYVALQPLGTEGQGLVPTRKKYSLLQMAFPIGIGFKYTIDRRWGIGLEYGLRYTFTDYIDDVSKTYYDNSLLPPEARALADRSDHSYPYITAPGAQRGDPRHKDAYMFAIFNINYKLRTGRTVYPLF